MAIEVKDKLVTLEDLKVVGDYAKVNRAKIEELEATLRTKRYGVSGIGQAASALTRTYDAVGMVAQVGTDGNNSAVVNDFDNAAPFMRRKCVGNWTMAGGRPKFNVQAYYGDADYVEDGTMGDYVAVECPLCFYSFDPTAGTLVISGHKYDYFEPFDIFCHNHDKNDLLERVYIPAYALALKDGKAVSLPGYDNEQGTYKSLLDATRTYGDGVLGNNMILMPHALNFYEWALFTVEFATQNCQAIMQGCSSLRSADNEGCTFKDATHVLVNNYNAARVPGEYIAITTSGSHVNMAYKATHQIVSSTRCDASGNPSTSGAYQLLEVTDLGKGYFNYDTTTIYYLAGRPYRTGACNGVSTPSGSPVSNTNGYYPCKYRWHENPYGNQFKTTVDLFNQRVGTGDSDYYLKWFYLLDPTSYAPSSASKPDAADLAGAAFEELDVQTLHANYVNGYIKSKKYAGEHPEVWIPFETTGASASTYTCDYASLVSSHVVRSVRLGGFWYNGANDGFSYANANYSPSTGYAFYGGDPCVSQ